MERRPATAVGNIGIGYELEHQGELATPISAAGSAVEPATAILIGWVDVSPVAMEQGQDRTVSSRQNDLQEAHVQAVAASVRIGPAFEQARGLADIALLYGPFKR